MTFRAQPGRIAAAFIVATGLFFVCASASYAQSIISGNVTGEITDATGAAIANAAVTLTNVGTNVAQKASTNTEGSYRFPFVPPGSYKLDVSANGFQGQQRTGINVAAGEPTTVNLQMSVASTTTSVTVTEGSQAIQTDNADVSTNFNQQMVANLPNPGGDITYFAQTAPGVVMNTQAGYGNFVADGMPATSNLFSINGQNYNDPFSGINNSGASNLLLGSNDIEETNVINSPYSGQYGQYAGSQVTYITKSGTNDFHGDAIYMWNGRDLNANQFFSNSVGAARPFNNFNQWATDVNGPIVKNKTFFDVDYEGLKSILPTASALTLIPSPQFQSATLANLAADGNSAEIPFYKQAFAVYNGSSGASAATPVPGLGCQGFTGPGGLGTTVPCADEFRVTPPNSLSEYQWSARVDQTLGNNDRGYVRVLRDNGFQPSYTSPFGPTFNDESNQPQMSGQVSEIHTFGPNTVNQFNGSALFYAAVFTPSDPTGALAALPTFLTFSGGGFASIGAFAEPGPFYFPQGRRVFGYQIIDDLSHVHGKHTFRVGFSWLRDSITDLDFEALDGPIHGAITTTLGDFFNGAGYSTSVNQVFPTTPEAALGFNTFGGYLADDWKVSDRLTLSLNLRLENYQNPTCASDCFSRLASSFNGNMNAAAATMPYDSMILGGEHTAYPHTQPLVWEPRIGVAWKPTKSNKTVIRAGAGIFADELPGVLAEDAAFNPPSLSAFTVSSPTTGPALPLAPGIPGGLFATAAAANAALQSQFRSGGSYSTISATVPGFSSPNFNSFPNYFTQPTYYKWNFEVQQQLPWNVVMNVNYSGMHGTHIPVADQGMNAYCPLSVCTSGFIGLPTAAPNAALGQVTQYLSAGISNYNGLTVSLQKRMSNGLSFNLNYTWSHALDDVSNGGVANSPFGILDTDPSITVPQNPFNIRGNYGSSDYDVRHYISASFVYSDMFRHSGLHWGPNAIFGGWTLSSNWFFRTGLPFTAIDNADFGALLGFNYEGAIFASPLSANLTANCGNAVNTPCLSASEYAPAGALTGFGTSGRNTLRGPGFFDVDMSLMKDIRIRERLMFSFGAQVYNLFNHPNFDQPVNDISNPLFGSTVAAVGPPTSLLGSFVGAGSSPRFVEIKGMIRF